MVSPPAYAPMLAVAGPLPGAAVEERWAFEMKWDGVRAVVAVGDGGLVVRSRSDRVVTAGYPELAGLPAALGADVVLDGELVALDDRGVPDFGRLQQRMHVRRPPRELLAAVPVTFLAFDLLWARGRPLVGESWEARREALEGLGLAAARWQVPPVFLADGAAATEVARSARLEGVVAKRRDSRYEPGGRSGSWVKVKHQRTTDVVVAGWKPGQGRRDGVAGSFLLGAHGPHGLVFVGHVGTGFTQAALARLAGLLRPLARPTSPFCVAGEVPREHARDARWVEPRLVGEVVFSGWTAQGRLRHPSWRGLREDVPADEVRLPEDRVG